MRDLRHDPSIEVFSRVYPNSWNSIVPFPESSSSTKLPSIGNDKHKSVKSELWMYASPPSHARPMALNIPRYYGLLRNVGWRFFFFLFYYYFDYLIDHTVCLINEARVILSHRFFNPLSREFNALESPNFRRPRTISELSFVHVPETTRRYLESA